MVTVMILYFIHCVLQVRKEQIPVFAAVTNVDSDALRYTITLENKNIVFGMTFLSAPARKPRNTTL